MDEATKTRPPEDGGDARPQYWAVIPAEVRYNAALPPSAKLLYAEISSLTNREGYCYASNEYFERLFCLTDRTIRRLLAALEAAGYVHIADGEGGHARRKIYAGINPLFFNGNPDKNVRQPGQK